MALSELLKSIKSVDKTKRIILSKQLLDNEKQRFRIASN